MNRNAQSLCLVYEYEYVCVSVEEKSEKKIAGWNYVCSEILFDSEWEAERLYRI